MPKPNEYANNVGGIGEWPPINRTELAMRAQGFLTENFDRSISQGGQISIDGTAYFMLIGLRAGDTVSNIALAVSTVGVTPTLSKVGLYSKTGVQLGVSADLGTLWTTTSSIKFGPLITPYVVPVDDAYYASFICKAATLPTFLRGSTSAVFASNSPGYNPGGTIPGLTDMPSPATIGNASPIAYWVGIT